MPQDALSDLLPTVVAAPTSGQALEAYGQPSAQLQAMLRWALANPFGHPAEAAAHFRISKITAHRILNCDAFKVMYGEALKDGDARGGHGLAEKVAGALSQGVDKLSEKLETVDSPKFILGSVDVLSKLHERLTPKASDSPGQPVSLTINNQVVALNGARDDMLDRARRAGPYPTNKPAIEASPYPERDDG